MTRRLLNVMFESSPFRLSSASTPIICSSSNTSESSRPIAAFVMAAAPIAAACIAAIPTALEEILRHCGDQLEEGLASIANAKISGK